MRFLAIAAFFIAPNTASTFCSASDRIFYDKLTGDNVISIKNCLKNGRYTNPNPATMTGCMTSAGVSPTGLNESCKKCMAGALFDTIDCEASCSDNANSWACALCQASPEWTYGTYRCFGAVKATSPCTYADELAALSVTQQKVTDIEGCISAISGTITEAQVGNCVTSNGVSTLSSNCIVCETTSVNTARSCATTCQASLTASACVTCQSAIQAFFAAGRCYIHEAPIMPSYAGKLYGGITATIMMIVVAIFSH